MPAPANPPGKLRIELNHAQTRVRLPRLNVALVGNDWDPAFVADPAALDVWQLPGVGSLALFPYCLRPEWKTSNSGPYSKLDLADFDNVGAGWEIKRDTEGGSHRLYKASGGMSASAISKVAYGANRAVYLSYYCFDVPTGATPGIDMELGFSDSGSGATGVSLRFNAVGTVEVWKDGKRRATYPERANDPDPAPGGSSGRSRANQYANWLILPMRGRELLLFEANSKDTYVHVFTEIDEEDPASVITANSKIWFYKREGSVDVEIAPVVFPASGKAVWKSYAFGRRPTSAQSRSNFINRAPFPALANFKVLGFGQGNAGETCSAIDVRREDGLTAWSAGDTGKIRLVATLVSDPGGRYSPTIYAGQVAWSDVKASTDATEIADVTGDVLAGTLEVPDDPLGVNVEVYARFGAAMEATGIGIHDSIPARVSLGSTVILDGYAEATDITDEIDPEARRITFQIRDGASEMERMQYRDTFPLDFYTLSRPHGPLTPSAVSTLFRAVSIDELDLSDENYVVGAIPPRDGASFSHPVGVGSSPAKEMGTLVDAFAFGYIWGQKPFPDGTLRGFFRPPHATGRASDLTVYARVGDAEEADCYGSQVWDDYHEDALPIEANEVRVQGIDPRTGEVISDWDEDLPSKNPTTKPSERPDNWCGTDRVVGYQSPRLTRLKDCTRLVEKTLPIVSARRFACSWGGGLLLFPGTDVPLWRGDTVTLKDAVHEPGGGYADREEVPIASFRVSFLRESDDFVFRDAHYVGGACLGRGARTRHELRGHLQQSAARGRRVFGLGSPVVSTTDLGNRV